MGEEHKDIREVMKEVVTSVSVILVLDDGNIDGCTISSLVSININIENACILFVLRKTSRTLEKIIEKKLFSISVLGESMPDIAKRFSTTRERVRLDELPSDIEFWHGVPVISKSSAIFLCLVDKIISDYDSIIVIAKVFKFNNGNCPPLVYYNRTFRNLGK